MRLAWIPEAPGHPGVYANRRGVGLKPFGKLQDVKPGVATLDPNDAHQFATCAECLEWCEQHPVPWFAPVEHGFEE